MVCNLYGACGLEDAVEVRLDALLVIVGVGAIDKCNEGWQHQLCGVHVI